MTFGLGRNRAAADHALRQRFGMLTHRLRPLPDFIVVGAQRCGTTSLHRYLELHPSVVPALVKEIHYFDRPENFRFGPPWYRAHFPTRMALARRRRATGTALSGEATPGYFQPYASARMTQLLGKARFIVLLRDPVERAYSGYRNLLRKGDVEGSFESVLERELGAFERRAEARASGRYRGVLGIGLYVEQLSALQERVSRERLLVLESSDFFADPRRVFATVLDFLGLPRRDLPDYGVHNQVPGADMLPESRRRLAAFYAPHNERLYEMLGRDLGWTR